MKELRLHGRGGQGVVTAAELVAQAAFSDGKYAQAFPSFGSERMGAPVTSFVRISDSAIRCRNQIYKPDYLIVQDSTLIGTVDVTAGLKPDGLMIIDTEKSPEELKLKTKARVLTIPATAIAIEVIGRAIQNTTLLGYFAAVTGLISFEGVKLALEHRFPAAIAIKNIKAVERAFELAKEGAHV